MALEAISKLFTDRSVRVDAFDIQHGIEQFLQQELHSEHVHCKVQSTSLRVDVRVSSPALAEAVHIREGDIRAYVLSQLQCSLGPIQVMLDM